MQSGALSVIGYALMGLGVFFAIVTFVAWQDASTETDAHWILGPFAVAFLVIGFLAWFLDDPNPDA